MRSTRLRLSILLLVSLGWVVAGSASAEQQNEPFFPRAGSRAYDARHYGAVISYQRRDGSIRVHEWVLARANAPLRSLSLDLWFGDSVGLERWPDIWLNEGFATWTQWYFSERHGGPSAARIFRGWLREPADAKELWQPPPGRPGTPENLFAASVYLRGAMALQALREKIGTEAMLRVLRTWATDNRYGNATTSEFIDLSEQVAGRPLDGLFQRWLYQRGKP